MIKSILVLSLVAGCNAGQRDCNDANKPVYPEIGGCVDKAANNTAGGSCSKTQYGDSCDAGLVCIGATCYPCGQLHDPPEPCCGSQSNADPGSCYSGTCALSTKGDGWYTCQGDVNTPPAPNCGLGEKPDHYVTILSSVCEQETIGFCAASDADAQAYVDATYGSVEHGPVGTDPDAVKAPGWNVCGTGDNCLVGNADGSYATTLWAFTHDQVVACEPAVDPGCTWVDGGIGNCPMY